MSRVELPVQLRTVASRSPPPVTESPPATVEVAVVEVIPSVERESPPLKVEVAVVEVALKVEAEAKPPKTALREMSTRPEKVEVAVEEVAFKVEAVSMPAITELPCTPRVVPGEVVPMPTFPPRNTAAKLLTAPVLVFTVSP